MWHNVTFRVFSSTSRGVPCDDSRIAGELGILRHDKVYEQALDYLAAETLTPDP